MTRNDHRYRIGSTGAGHCSGSARLIERLGDLAIGTRAAVRDGLQVLPHPPLERGRLYIERHIQLLQSSVQVFAQRAGPRAQERAIGLQVGGGEFAA